MDSKGNYFIEVGIGSKTINCTSEKDVTVSGIILILKEFSNKKGYTGTFSCPSPNDFCGQIMSEGFCRRKCSGRGSCIHQQCTCVEGWSGFDCSKHTYVNIK